MLTKLTEMIESEAFMKFLGLITCAFLLSANAFAFPNVGDTVTVQVTFIRDSDGKVTGREIHTREFIYHDGSRGHWSLKHTRTFSGGKTEVRYEALNDDDEDLDTVKADRMLKDCDALGYQRETVVTPKGSFASCRVYFSNDKTTRWYSQVPFNFVKISSPGWWGATATIELIDFQIAN